MSGLSFSSESKSFTVHIVNFAISWVLKGHCFRPETHNLADFEWISSVYELNFAENAPTTEKHTFKLDLNVNSS